MAEWGEHLTIAQKNRNMAVIRGLHPAFRPLVRRMIATVWSKHRIGWALVHGWRSPEEQDSLYESGRSRPGKIVTMARAWESWHNYGLAIDAYPCVNGQIIWDDFKLYRAIAQAVRSLDTHIVWGGDWDGDGLTEQGEDDLGHFEWHPGYKKPQEALNALHRGLVWVGDMDT